MYGRKRFVPHAYFDFVYFICRDDKRDVKLCQKLYGLAVIGSDADIGVYDKHDLFVGNPRAEQIPRDQPAEMLLGVFGPPGIPVSRQIDEKQFVLDQEKIQFDRFPRPRTRTRQGFPHQRVYKARFSDIGSTQKRDFEFVVFDDVVRAVYAFDVHGIQGKRFHTS